MPKYELVSNTGDYAPVADRIALFYSRYPKGRILTRIISRTDVEITVEASVYRSFDEPGPSATGLAAERFDDGEVNAVACLENTETSAIGRALANLGLTASPLRPNREEIDKANRARVRRVAEATSDSPSDVQRRAPRRTPPDPLPTNATIKTRVGRGILPPCERHHDPAPRLHAGDDALQRAADAVMDALGVLDEAERAGFDVGQAKEFRKALLAPDAPPSAVTRTERAVRRWLVDVESRAPGSVSEVPDG